MPLKSGVRCATREKNDGEKYVICYGGGGGKGKSKDADLSSYMKFSVPQINAALEKTKKGGSKAGAMDKLKINKLKKLQRLGGLKHLGQAPAKKAPAKKAPAKKAPPRKKKTARAPNPARVGKPLWSISDEIALLHSGVGDAVGAKPPGDKTPGL
jgi:hypothetical protein